MLKVKDTEYLEQVKQWATENDLNDHLNEALKRIEDRRETIELWPDFAPHSFAICAKNEQGDFLWNGGLIFQGNCQPADGSAPSFTVSFDATRTGWFLHT